MNRAVFWYWMGKAQKRANLKVTGGLHILRHTFCARLAMLGAPTMAIKELAGHEDISTTQRYMHLTPAAKNFSETSFAGGRGYSVVLKK